MQRRRLSLRQVLDELSQDERLVCIWKRAGFSSKEIAEYQGRSVASIDALFSRVKQKLRTLLREQTENGHNGSGNKRRKAHSPGRQRTKSARRSKTSGAD